MKEILGTLIGAVVTLLLVAVLCLFPAAVIYLFWPLIVPAMFPGWVQDGAVARVLEFGVCYVLVLFNVLMGLFIKRTSTVKVRGKNDPHSGL